MQNPGSQQGHLAQTGQPVPPQKKAGGGAIVLGAILMIASLPGFAWAVMNVSVATEFADRQAKFSANAEEAADDGKKAEAQKQTKWANQAQAAYEETLVTIGVGAGGGILSFGAGLALFLSGRGKRKRAAAQPGPGYPQPAQGVPPQAYGLPSHGYQQPVQHHGYAPAPPHPQHPPAQQLAAGYGSPAGPGVGGSAPGQGQGGWRPPQG